MENQNLFNIFDEVKTPKEDGSYPVRGIAPKRIFIGECVLTGVHISIAISVDSNIMFLLDVCPLKKVLDTKIVDSFIVLKEDSEYFKWTRDIVGAVIPSTELYVFYNSSKNPEDWTIKDCAIGAHRDKGIANFNQVQ